MVDATKADSKLGAPAYHSLISLHSLRREVGTPWLPPRLEMIKLKLGSLPPVYRSLLDAGTGLKSPSVSSDLRTRHSVSTWCWSHTVELALGSEIEPCASFCVPPSGGWSPASCSAAQGWRRDGGYSKPPGLTQFLKPS